MSKLGRVADRLDRIGLRRPIAALATLAYPRQRFSVDRKGRWINAQGECTIVSPTIHTARFDAVRDWVMATWCRYYVPRPGDTVFEIGAGVGEEAIVFSKMVGPAGRVVAVEAHPATFACLEQSVARSGATNVIARDYAIADRDGELIISTTDNHLANSVVTDGQGDPVPARTLDSLAAELGVSDVAFLKMNIEGAERLAVKGMSALAPNIRNLCISCHDFVADETGDNALRTREEVRGMLVQAGFKLFDHDWADAPPWQRDYLFATREG